MIHARQSKSHWERSEGSSTARYGANHRTTLHSKWRLTGGQERREPQWATWIECQKFWFRSWNPAEQLAPFQHLGRETAADGKPESELKVKPEEGCIFKKGRYNCIIQGENIILHQRQEVLFELVLKGHRELQMCLVACISTTTLKVWIYSAISWRYLGESKKR